MNYTNLFFIYFISSLLLCPQQPVQAQQYKFHQLSIDQGMSQNTVQVITQDQQGFIWLGTQDGLNRFDGYNFLILRHERDNPNSLSDNFITALYPDSNGHLWIGTNSGGLNRYHIATKTFTRFRHNPADPNSPGSDNILCLAPAPGGMIFIGTSNGLSIFNPANETFINIKAGGNQSDQLNSNIILSVYTDSTGNVWLGTDGGGLSRLHQDQSGQLSISTWRRKPGTKLGLASDRITSVVEEKSGLLWIGTGDGGVQRFFTETGRFEAMNGLFPSTGRIFINQINTVFRDRQNRIWIGSDNDGLAIYQPESGAFRRYTADDFNAFSLCSNQVLSIFQDHSGLIWLGSRDRGISTTNPDAVKFIHLRHEPNDPQSLSFNTIRSFYSRDAEKMWVGTYGGGLDLLNLNTGNFKHYTGLLGDQTTISNLHISALFEEEDGALWVGTWGSGLKKMVGGKVVASYSHQPGSSSSIADNRIHAIVPAGTGWYWIGTENGLSVFNSRAGTFRNYFHEPGDKKTLSDNRIQSNCLIKDDQGYLWVGTWNGLNRIKLQANGYEPEQIFRYLSGMEEDYTISDNRITALLLDTKESSPTKTVLWIGTYTGGLNKLVLQTNPSTGQIIEKFTAYTTSDGLPNDVIYGLLQDQQGNLWITTNKGLAQMNLMPGADKLFTVFSEMDGLQSNQFFWGAAFKNVDGRMFFGGINGFNVFHPDSMPVNRHIPEVRLTSIRRYNQDIFPDREISTFKKIELPFIGYVISLGFAALDFNIPGKNQFIYMLEGFDQRWIPAGTKHEVTYTNLDPGSYTFRLKASNNDGVWNEQGLSVAIHIRPAWWQTALFKIMTAALIFSLVFFLFRIRMVRIRRKNAELEEYNRHLNHQIEERERLQNQLTQAQKMESIGTLAGGVAHDFNNLLTVINGHAELALRKTDTEAIRKDLRAILNSGDRAIALTSRLLAFSRKQVIQPVVLNINSVISGVEDMLRRLIGEDIRIETRLDPLVPNILADKGQLDQIIMNLVINARDAINEKNNPLSEKRISIETRFKTDRNGYIETLLAGVSGAHILLSVTDTGIGMDQETQTKIFDPFFTTKEQGKGTGLGLSTVYGILKQNNADISVYSEPGFGTTIKIYWPVTSATECIQEHSTGQSVILSGSENILLVEDDENVRSFAFESLESFGYKVHSAENGEQALNILQNTAVSIDLLVTDVIMPGINGHDLAKQIQVKYPLVKILFTSGYSDNLLADKGALREGFHFLQKPYSINELAVKIRNVLET